MLDRLRPVWRRVIARWIDIIAVGWLAVVLLEVIDGVTAAVLAVVVLVGYEAATSLRWGRSPGKALLGLRVRAVDGEPLGSWALALRPVVLFASFAVPWAWWIPVWTAVLVVWMTVDGRGRVLHDRVVGSVVIDGRTAPGETGG